MCGRCGEAHNNWQPKEDPPSAPCSLDAPQAEPVRRFQPGNPFGDMDEVSDGGYVLFLDYEAKCRALAEAQHWQDSNRQCAYYWLDKCQKAEHERDAARRRIAELEAGNG